MYLYRALLSPNWLIVLLLCLLLPTSAHAAPGDIDETFGTGGAVSTYYGGGNFTVADQVVQADGKTVVAGRMDSDIGLVRYHIDGTLDHDFGNEGVVATDIGRIAGGTLTPGSNDTVRKMTLMNDGRLVVVGHASSPSPENFVVVRYMPDGSLDTSFGGGDGAVITPVGTDGHDYPNAVVALDDGTLVVSGAARISDQYEVALVRYLADGTLDTSFGEDGIITTSLVPFTTGGRQLWVAGLSVMADGRLVVSGETSTSFREPQSQDLFILRYLPDGDLDVTFSDDGFAILDTRTATGGGSISKDRAYAQSVLADGRILLAGSALLATGYDFVLARYQVDGALDTSFGGGDGIVTTDIGPSINGNPGRDDDILEEMALLSDGRIVVAGRIEMGEYVVAARYLADGTLDTTFDGDGVATTHIGILHDGVPVSVMADGRVVVATYVLGGGNYQIVLVRYLADGALDTTFSGDGIEMTNTGNGHTQWQDISLQPDGKIVVTGFGRLARYLPTGKLDLTFGGGNGFVYVPIAAKVMDLMADGGIVVGGTINDENGFPYYAAARFLTDGTPDTTFGVNGMANTNVRPLTGAGWPQMHDMALMADGRIVLVGNAILRYRADGTPDPTFAGDGAVITAAEVYAFAVDVMDDGKIVLAGRKMLRYNADGSLDTSFSGDGIVDTDEYGLADDLTLLDDGRIVLVTTDETSSWTDIVVSRYLTNGTLDTTFAGDGVVSIDIGWQTGGKATRDRGTAVSVLDDGRMLVLGLVRIPTTSINVYGSDIALVRYRADGTIDSTFGGGDGVFNTDSRVEHAAAMAIADDGKILLAGIRANLNLLLRLHGDLSPVANADSYAIDAGATLNVPAPGVLSNDSNPDPSATLTAILVSPTGNGALTLTADGSFTYTPNAGFSGTDSFQYYARNSQGQDSEPVQVSLTVNPVASTPQVVISLNENGNVGTFAYRDEDIILWNTTTARWNMIFDGSDVGLGNVDVDAFTFYNGKILLSLDVDLTLGSLGVIDDADILAFTATSLGNTTKGTFALYFDGSDVGLDTDGEDIDAIGFDKDGRLVISVNGALSVPREPSGTVTGNDEDLIFFNNGLFGSNTQGKWIFYFDGSDVGLTTAGEDLQALWANHAENKLYYATYDDYAVPGISGNEDDIIICTYTTLGLATACTHSRYWDGQEYGITSGAIDGIQLVTAAPTAGANAQESGDEVDALAILEMAAPSGDPLLGENEPWIEAPGDDTTEFPGDDADLPDEPDNSEVEGVTRSTNFLCLTLCANGESLDYSCVRHQP